VRITQKASLGWLFLSTDKIKDGMYFKAYQNLVLELGCEAACLFALLQLIARRRGNSEFGLDYGTIKKFIGLSRKKVNRINEALCAKGLLKVEKGGPNKLVRYKIC
jgi:hypothetical protein